MRQRFSRRCRRCWMPTLRKCARGGGWERVPTSAVPCCAACCCFAVRVDGCSLGGAATVAGATVAGGRSCPAQRREQGPQQEAGRPAGAASQVSTATVAYRQTGWKGDVELSACRALGHLLAELGGRGAPPHQAASCPHGFPLRAGHGPWHMECSHAPCLRMHLRGRHLAAAPVGPPAVAEAHWAPCPEPLCSAAADVSQPSRASGDAERKGRLLRLKLTDGRASCVGVELQPLPFSMEQARPGKRQGRMAKEGGGERAAGSWHQRGSWWRCSFSSKPSAPRPQLCPGTKVRLRGAAVHCGVVLLEPRCLELLGGRVAPLAEAWETQQKYGGATLERTGGPLLGCPSFCMLDPAVLLAWRPGARRACAAGSEGTLARPRPPDANGTPATTPPPWQMPKPTSRPPLGTLIQSCPSMAADGGRWRARQQRRQEAPLHTQKRWHRPGQARRVPGREPRLLSSSRSSSGGQRALGSSLTSPPLPGLRSSSSMGSRLRRKRLRSRRRRPAASSSSCSSRDITDTAKVGTSSGSGGLAAHPQRRR